MSLLDPVLPDYDPMDWRRQPFDSRARLVCQSWALHGYGTPLPVFLAYLVKIGLYVGAWMLFCSMSPDLGGIGAIAEWWLEPLAFQKAIVWSMLFEALGLGCGSGPLTGRYAPPVGGFLYFLRPRTIKRPLVPGLPVVGGSRRGFFDVALYAAFVALSLAALLAPTIGIAHLVSILAVAAVLITADRTMFLVARGEHYLVTIAVFALASSQTEWIAGAMAVQAALWFFAGVSKLNHHFPAVVCVMTSNSPVARWPLLKKRMYRSYPDDLRPSGLATVLAHAGTALELAVPLTLFFAPAGSPMVLVGLAMMLLLHGFITSNVPMGVPIEWNVMVVYGGFALFWNHQTISVLDTGPVIGALVLACAVAVPIAGNLFPSQFSFLPSMRYYAGNWAMSIWLFRGDSYRKLYDHLTMTAPWIYDQLGRFYDRATAAALVGKVMAFRLMHLHGRSLGILVPRALPDGAELADYEWLDGELVAGMVLGWNFGDGHLHDERMLATIQRECDFASGELRCIFVESQPFFQPRLHYRVVDAREGELESGHLDIGELRSRQPWETP
ncbi:MAG: DUF3556 domain-containing protein [Proteobacteria bacterium]|nr:DUF3556 domain-containing protein [Pseudomonadota bacterium]